MTPDEAIGKLLAEVSACRSAVVTLTGEVRGLRAEVHEALRAGRATDRNVAALGVELASAASTAARGSGAKAGGGVAAVVAAVITAIGHLAR